nr:Tn3 family transposase [Geomicrobium halophilum]
MLPALLLGDQHGTGKNGRISDVGYSLLAATSDNFIRLETLKEAEANDRISNASTNLPIFHHYDIFDEFIHSSSDGQKCETQINTINARYSPKY